MDLRLRKAQKGVFKLKLVGDKSKKIEKEMRNNSELHDTYMPILCDLVISGGEGIPFFEQRKQRLAEKQQGSLIKDIDEFYKQVLKTNPPVRLRKKKRKNVAAKKNQKTVIIQSKRAAPRQQAPQFDQFQSKLRAPHNTQSRH